MTTPRYIPVRDAAAILGCTRQNVHLMIRDGKLRFRWAWRPVGPVKKGRKVVLVLASDCRINWA